MKTILTLLAICSLSLSAIAQTNAPATNTTFVSTVSGLFDLNDTNSLVNAKELSAIPVFKWDALNDKAGGGVKLDWFVTDQQGATMSYTAFEGGERTWQFGYKTRTVFGKMEVGLEAGSQQNTDNSFGDVVLYTAPSLTYRIKQTKNSDIRVTLGADITPDSTNPWLGLVLRFSR